MPKKIALLIGVGTYGTGLTDLKCPENGVSALKAVLKDPARGGFDTVLDLVDPDVGEMRSQIAATFAQAQKDDLVLLYFTGHGIKDMAGDFYLASQQTCLFENGNLNTGTAIEGEFVRRIVRNSYAQRKVLILDCCMGAALADGFLTMDDGAVDLEAQLGGEGWALMTSASSRNYALEQEGEPLSVYTRYLVEGLRTGAAAPAERAVISVRDLHCYVEKKVKAAAPSMQPTIFNGKLGDSLILAKVTKNPELLYRQELLKRVTQGRIRPVVRQNLNVFLSKLEPPGLSAQQVEDLETEVLRPFLEKEGHVKLYLATTEAELKDAFPLDGEAVKELRDLQRGLSLGDGDLKPGLVKLLRKQDGIAEAEEAQTLQALLGKLPLPKPAEPQKPPTATASAPKSPPPSNSSRPTKPTPPTRRDDPPVVQPPTNRPSPEQFEFATVKLTAQGKVAERQTLEAQQWVEDLGNGVRLEMVRIPAGDFLMGSPKTEAERLSSEGPQYRVQVPEFWLGKVAVTQAQWRRVEALPQQRRELKPDPARFKGDQRPVECVSWDDAQEFCARLSQVTGKVYRLPSEAEWEYACRAGTTTPFSFGATLSIEVANYDGNYTYGQGQKGKYREQTVEVGSLPANGFGLYEMHGNVWEWCEDEWHDSYQGAPTDGTAWRGTTGVANDSASGGFLSKLLGSNETKQKSEQSLRLLRGGSWGYYPGLCRSANRSRSPRGNANGHGIGFRVACCSPPRT